MRPPPTSSHEFQIDFIGLDRFRLDGGAMFGVVPKPLWEKSNPADTSNRIAMGCQSLLLRRANRVILIDSGLGEKWDRKRREIYAIESISANSALAPFGLTSDDVTDVVLTHLHFDHAGGLTWTDHEGTPKPSFPNARHWIQADHLDWARSPSEKDRGSFPSENIEPLVQADLFHLVRGEEELFTGFRVMPLYGHTKAMQAILIHGDPPIFFPTDLLPMAPHLHLPFIMAYDIEPITTLREKEKYLALAAREGWQIYLQHEPIETLGRVEMFQGKYRLGREQRGSDAKSTITSDTK